MLRDEIRPDIASFFMLTPLPGSRDHRDLVAAGASLDPDLNRYDTFHPVIDHPRMSRAAWMELYRDAWRDFYDPEHLRLQMRRAPPTQRATLLQMYLWYGAAIHTEDFHPMMTGFLRLRPRSDRRAGCVPESRTRHCRRRVLEIGTALRGYARLLRDLERIWRSASPGVANQPVSGSDWSGFLRALLTTAPTTMTDKAKHPYAKASPKRL
jgi:hypothetical protein